MINAMCLNPRMEKGMNLSRFKLKCGNCIWDKLSADFAVTVKLLGFECGHKCGDLLEFHSTAARRQRASCQRCTNGWHTIRLGRLSSWVVDFAIRGDCLQLGSGIPESLLQLIGFWRPVINVAIWQRSFYLSYCTAKIKCCRITDTAEVKQFQVRELLEKQCTVVGDWNFGNIQMLQFGQSRNIFSNAVVRASSAQQREIDQVLVFHNICKCLIRDVIAEFKMQLF